MLDWNKSFVATGFDKDIVMLCLEDGTLYDEQKYTCLKGGDDLTRATKNLEFTLHVLLPVATVLIFFVVAHAIYSYRSRKNAN